MVLEGLYGALGRVCSVQVGGYKLKRNSLAAHIILEAGWTFIVDHLELRAKSLISDLGVEDGVGSDDFYFTSRFDRLGDDCVAVMVIDYHKVISAATGGDGETASLVHGDFTSQFDCLDKKLMG